MPTVPVTQRSGNGFCKQHVGWSWVPQQPLPWDLLLPHRDDAAGAPAVVQAQERSIDQASPAKHREANDVFRVWFYFSSHFSIFSLSFFFFSLPRSSFLLATTDVIF